MDIHFRLRLPFGGKEEKRKKGGCVLGEPGKRK
jgi:hypothetical protein